MSFNCSRRAFCLRLLLFLADGFLGLLLLPLCKAWLCREAATYSPSKHLPGFFSQQKLQKLSPKRSLCLAGRDLRFISLSMSGCFSLGALLLPVVSSRGFGLAGIWWALAGFQWSWLFLSLCRLISPDGILYSEDVNRFKLEKLRA